MKTAIYTLTLGTILMSGAAQADDWTSNFYFKAYVGGDYQYTHIDYSDGNSDVLDKNLNGGDVHIGARVNQYLGFEAGYEDTAYSTKDNVLGSGFNTKIKLQGYTLDALGYLPVTDDKKLELIGTAGVTRLEAKLDIPGIGNGNEWETKGRVGGGAQYWVSDNLNVRGLVRYQGADFDDTANNAIVGTIGVNYQF